MVALDEQNTRRFVARSLPPGLTIRRVPRTEFRSDPAKVRTHRERPRGDSALRRPLRPGRAARRARPALARRRREQSRSRDALGWTHADVIDLDIDDVALNRTVEIAERNPSVFSPLPQSLEVNGALDAVGFDEGNISWLLDQFVAAGDPLHGIAQEQSSTLHNEL